MSWHQTWSLGVSEKKTKIMLHTTTCRLRINTVVISRRKQGQKCPLPAGLSEQSTFSNIWLFHISAVFQFPPGLFIATRLRHQQIPTRRNTTTRHAGQLYSKRTTKWGKAWPLVRVKNQSARSPEKIIITRMIKTNKNKNYKIIINNNSN